MEQNENLSLFGLSIDPTAKSHLGEAARWGKFLAIMGFIFCGLFVVMGLFFSTMMASLSSYSSGYDNGMASGLGTMMAVIYIIIAAVYFFPCLFLFRFASKMKEALLTNEQDALNTSFQNLKSLLKFFGIITIIFLVLWLLGMLTALAGASFAS